jgi:NAD(P)-dependent dehydrogenase (short-subunit alcohol dehydrogenase family)
MGQVSYALKDKWGRDKFDFLINNAGIETDFTKPAFDANPQAREMIASQTALGRVGVPDDIGGVVAFLCSEDARWVNGQRLEASGGIFL